MRLLLAALALLAPLAWAEEPAPPAGTPVSPQAFRAYAEGHTLHFERDGAYAGSERFEPGGRTVWRYPDGTCIDGVWRAHGAQLCFLYDPQDGVLCWRVLREGESLVAILLGDGPDAGLRLRVTGRETAPPLCGAPGPAT